MATVRHIDVRDLEPPEPLEIALEMANSLGPGEYLHMLHRREPYPLYRLLEQYGFRYSMHSGGNCPFEILIWRDGDSDAERAVQSVITPSV